ncbi:hypothetical protein BESB_039000 [Besnoitia besnoiti]|uniref:Transmembrane protein n=1 Tax=Besnoitia besnoiti TaxID=94643 RepID=A0A2A9MNY1_BESBE|nr:hypothetical protein BESB_039000 [Besnoitia besnoiti]PFH37442.1 hypothetical protein BESB_039000 [Besnoitia besnoiti]
MSAAAAAALAAQRAPGDGRQPLLSSSSPSSRPRSSPPYRRSLLREVLSEAELTELGLDASVDDSPSVPPSISRKQFRRLFFSSFLWILLYWGSLLALLVYVHRDGWSARRANAPQKGVYVHLGAGRGDGADDGKHASTHSSAEHATADHEDKTGNFLSTQKNGGRRFFEAEKQQEALSGRQAASALPDIVTPSSASGAASGASFPFLELGGAYTTAEALKGVVWQGEGIAPSPSAVVPESSGPELEEPSWRAWLCLVCLCLASMLYEVGVLSFLRYLTPPPRDNLFAFCQASSSLASAASSPLLATGSGCLTLLLDFVVHFCQLGDVLFIAAVLPPRFPLSLFLCCLYSVSLNSLLLFLLQLRALLSANQRDNFALHDAPASCFYVPAALASRSVSFLLSCLDVVLFVCLFALRLVCLCVALGAVLCAHLCKACGRASCLLLRARPGAQTTTALAPAHAAGAQRRLFRRAFACCGEGDAVSARDGREGDRGQALLSPGNIAALAGASSRGRAADEEGESSQPQGSQGQERERLPGCEAPADVSSCFISPSFFRGAELAADEGESSAPPPSFSPPSRRLRGGRGDGGILQQVLHGFLHAKTATHAGQESRFPVPSRSAEPESPSRNAPRSSSMPPSRSRAHRSSRLPLSSSLVSESLASPFSSAFGASLPALLFPSRRGAREATAVAPASEEALKAEDPRRARREETERARRRRDGDAEGPSAPPGAKDSEGVDRENGGSDEVATTPDVVEGGEVLKLANLFLLLDMASSTDALKNRFLPADSLETFEFGASILSLSRFYMGDLCLLFFLVYAVGAFGSVPLPAVLLCVRCFKLTLQSLLFLLKSDASIWELWCYDLE